MLQKPDWINLFQVLCWLRSDGCPYRWTLINPEEALKNALVSGKVPMRGKARYHSEYQQIDVYITPDAEFWIAANTAVLLTHKHANRLPYWTTYESVQVDKPCLEKWIAEYAVEKVEEASGFGVCEQSPNGNVAAETKFKQWLAEQPDSPVRRKEDVRAALKNGSVIGELGTRVSGKAFERAWRDEARESWKKPGSKANCPPFKPSPLIEPPR
jgi:hypothetical protein